MKLELTFGALCDPLVKQLPQPKQLRRTWIGCCKTWQRDADAITRLAIHRHLTKSETDRARRRLIDTIHYFYKRHNFLRLAESGERQ